MISKTNKLSIVKRYITVLHQPNASKDRIWRILHNKNIASAQTQHTTTTRVQHSMKRRHRIGKIVKQIPVYYNMSEPKKSFRKI